MQICNSMSMKEHEKLTEKGMMIMMTMLLLLVLVKVLMEPADL